MKRSNRRSSRAATRAERSSTISHAARLPLPHLTTRLPLTEEPNLYSANFPSVEAAVPAAKTHAPQADRPSVRHVLDWAGQSVPNGRLLVPTTHQSQTESSD